MIKDDIKEILNSLEINEEKKIEHLEELVTDRDCIYGGHLDDLLKIMLPSNLDWDEFIESLECLYAPHVDMETFLAIGNGIEIFVLKLLIELHVRSGKEIDCSV